jgi:hypothetical protein
MGRARALRRPRLENVRVTGDAQLDAAIAREEERLSELDGLRDSVAGRLDELRTMRNRASSCESDTVAPAS